METSFQNWLGLFVLICNALRDRNCCVTIIKRVINWSAVNSWNCPGTPQFISPLSLLPVASIDHWLISWTVLLLRPSGQHTCFNWSYGPKSISRASPIVPQGWWECAPCSLPDNYAQCVSRASISNKYFQFALQIGKAFTILRHTIYLVLALLGTIFTLSWKCFGTSWLLYGLFVVTFFSEFQLKIKIFFLFLGG